MTTVLYAQPYDICANGFYFEDIEDYRRKAKVAVNEYGDPVEEFEIQFIDGEALDCALVQAWGINQANLSRVLEAVDEWEEHEKIRFIIAVGECGYDAESVADDPGGLDVDIYEEKSLRDLAERFVDDGLFGEVPEAFRFYIDYDAIARDLSADYSATTIAGERLIYRCG